MIEFEALQLFGYWRSSAAYRVRIALNIKGLEYEQVPVHLLKDGGQHKQPDYLKLNPQGLVPILMDGERVYRQSLAIIEYLEEVFPEPAVLPADLRSRARVRALAQIVACDIHPLNNLRVLSYLKREFGLSQEQRDGWYRHWIAEGFSVLEQELAESPMTGEYCEGDMPTLVDICLVPQVYNALRFECPMDEYPTIRRIYDSCLQLPAFAQAAPEKQPDANT